MTSSTWNFAKSSAKTATSIQYPEHDVVSVKISAGAVVGGFYPILKSAKFLTGMPRTFAPLLSLPSLKNQDMLIGIFPSIFLF